MTRTRPMRASRPPLTPPGTDGSAGGEPEDDAPATEPAPPESGLSEGEPARSGPESEPPRGEPAGPEAGPESGRSPGGRWRRAVSAGIAAVLVAGGCGFFHEAHQLRAAEAARNRALTDTEATARVAGEIDNALARVFSYTPDGTATAERSARAVLDGRAARQYRDLFAQVRDDLADQRVTLSTEAVRTGVIELDGERARLLVFLDQTSRRGDGEATTAAAQLTVTARLVNDRWRIVDLKPR
ncbi:hypothetical protein ACFWHW_17500 [Streptomyces pharetrae]|uniref:hypothetical protein n=1 Tax=Streptomyces pharetrae TaxID=291370 RepID=UPI0036670C22